MKKHLLLGLASKWKGFDRNVKKKVLIGLGVLSVVAFSLMIFVGILLFKATGYVFSQAGQLTSSLQNPLQIPNQLPALQQEILRSFNIQNCSAAVMGLIALEPWIRVPLAQTFNSFKAACWPISGAQECDGWDCSEEKPKEQVDLI